MQHAAYPDGNPNPNPNGKLDTKGAQLAGEYRILAPEASVA